MTTRPAWKAPRAPKRVTGYHGCHIDVARRVLDGQPLLHSTNEYDWLGSGVYFWEYAPDRVLEWARAKFGDNAAVIEATLTLGNCVNLLDSTHFRQLQDAYGRVLRALQADGLSIPRNERGRHLLDRLVIDTYCSDFAAETNRHFDSVRGCFPEGNPVYDGSRILRYTHVQVAVLNRERCISNLKLVHFT